MSKMDDSGNLTSIPQLESLPEGATRRLVDAGVLHQAASLSGFAERYRRAGTPHTVHVWWARRPHASMRALLFASLCGDSSPDKVALLEDLCSPVPSLDTLNQAREYLSGGGRPPRVLDMFGGGGTIPFEAANLGAESHSLDSNELSVFTQRCLLEYGAGLDSATSERLLAESGERVLERLTVATAPLFPARDKVFGYYWTYSLNCPACGERCRLSRRPWLSRKQDKRIAVRFAADDRGIVGEVADDFVNPSVWSGRSGQVVCPGCGETITRPSIKACREECVALAGLSGGRGGKTFTPLAAAALPAAESVAGIEADTLRAIGGGLPTGDLPRWSGIVNPALYGLETYADLFNPRQRAVALLLIKELRDEYGRLIRERSEREAKFVIGMLSSLIDQLVDWNCRLAMWIPQNEQVGRAFCGPGVAMIWDYMETDPVLTGPANLRSKLERIKAGAAAALQLPAPVTVRHGFAQSLPYPDDHIDAVVTDPPYYDNIFYNALADFFYAWKRPLLGILEPELFKATRTNADRELVASKQRSGSATRAHESYCRELGLALTEAERVLRSDGVLALVYSHGSLHGWEALVRAWRTTNMRITSVQPLSIERKQRPRAMSARAVNTCMVFTARGELSSRESILFTQLQEEFSGIAEHVVSTLDAAGWGADDIGVAAFAQAVGMLANVAGVNASAESVSDLDVLTQLAQDLNKILPGFKVTARQPL
ncbi:MAG: DUF1156 domain-containing protein [bacterium]|nr:DUF1156 domain-containing protein [bacterium]